MKRPEYHKNSQGPICTAILLFASTPQLTLLHKFPLNSTIYGQPLELTAVDNFYSDLRPVSQTLVAVNFYLNSAH